MRRIRLQTILSLVISHYCGQTHVLFKPQWLVKEIGKQNPAESFFYSRRVSGPDKFLSPSLVVAFRAN